MKTNAYLATHDALTGLPNEFLFLDRLNQAILTSERGTIRLALLIIVINNYNTINKKYSQNFCDRLTLKIAKCLKEILREPDTVTRRKDNSFSILLPQIKNQIILNQLVWRIEKELSKPFEIDTTSVHLSISISQGTYPYNGIDALTLLHYVVSDIKKNHKLTA